MASNRSKEPNKLAQCLRCKHGLFTQWMQNPIIAYCQVFQERFVAECNRQCKMFVASDVEHPEVTHYDHYEEEDFF